LVRRAADIIGREGGDTWWTKPAEYFLPEGFFCPECQGAAFRQEKDIFDVWLDSGSSQAAVLGRREELNWPCDLVLEGNDQYRGWFQSLLTCGVATRGEPPYRMVLTHGMVLDQAGREMHKSLGNTIDPLEIVQQYGGDILRLWVAASDFRGDVRISDEIMRQLAESYRKIRNTFRFLLGNLSGFDPHQEPLTGPVHDALNRWALARVNQWLEEALEAYQGYHFHTLVHSLVRLMTIDLSSFYLDVMKDRLYTLSVRDPLRVETQRVLYYILAALTRALAPILVFTADEVYEHMPKREGDPDSVHLATWMERWEFELPLSEAEQMDRLMGYREVILKALEELRAAKVIGNSLQADVTLTLPGDDPEIGPEGRALLTEMVMAARIEIVAGSTVSASAAPTLYARCQRCWRHTDDVSTDDELCGRCRQVLAGAGR
jgi:isoleucyl-tRNA synthetase